MSTVTPVVVGLVCAVPVATVGVVVDDTPPATASLTIERIGAVGTGVACVDTAEALVSVVTPGVVGTPLASISGLRSTAVALATGSVTVGAAVVCTPVACSSTPALAVGNTATAVVGELVAVMVAIDCAGV